SDRQAQHESRGIEEVRLRIRRVLLGNDGDRVAALDGKAIADLAAEFELLRHGVPRADPARVEIEYGQGLFVADIVLPAQAGGQWIVARRAGSRGEPPDGTGEEDQAGDSQDCGKRSHDDSSEGVREACSTRQSGSLDANTPP